MIKVKKCTALLLAVLITVCFSGCRAGSSETETTPPATSSLSGMSLADIVTQIYTKHPMELSLMTMEVDLADEYAVKGYLGLDSADKIDEAVASESGFGSQAYSLVLCRVKNPGDAQTVAKQMFDGIDQRKWVCVEADDLIVSAYHDLVLLVMIGSEYADSATAAQLTDAFAQVCGHQLDVRMED